MNKFVPYYVGFPRSGSHWLRISLENYTDGKSPISNFLGARNETVQQMYARARRGEFKGVHDTELTFEHSDVIYMYRNPVDTIYSQLKYENEKICLENIDTWLDIWIKHTEKWYFNETFTKNKVIICYENLVSDFVSEFSKVLEFLSLDIDEKRIIKSNPKKESIKKIIHDKKVINLSPTYDSERKEFVDKYKEYIESKVPKKILKLWDK